MNLLPEKLASSSCSDAVLFSMSGSYVPYLKKSQALLQLFHADYHLHHFHPPYHHSFLQQCWQVDQLPELHVNSNVKERNQLNTYINSVILLKRQVQILGILVIAVGYNITKITCSVFLGCFFSFFASSLLLLSFTFAVIS